MLSDIALGKRSITTYMKDSCRTQVLLLWQLLIEMLVSFFELPDFEMVFLGFYSVNFPCFGGNRVNIQGVSSDKATRKSMHKF